MNNIKLNRIDDFQLTKNEKQQLKGGEGRNCCCACAHVNNGGSTSPANALANYYGGENGLWSPECPLSY